MQHRNRRAYMTRASVHDEGPINRGIFKTLKFGSVEPAS